MSAGDALEAGRQLLLVSLKLSLPILIPVLVTGILVSIFQAATQIQEFTLTFVPKLLVAIVVFVLAGAWMLGTLISFFEMMLQKMPGATG